jgi:hypothetical protein
VAKILMRVKKLEVIERGIGRDQERILISVIQPGQGSHQAPGVATNTATLFEGRGVINTDVQFLTL